MKCPKCGGYGKITNYKHVEGGVCFLCWGTGAITAEQHVEFQEDENKKAARREKRWTSYEELQAQKKLHEDRIQNGYYKKKREEEEKSRIRKLQERHAVDNPDFVQKTADESFKEFFKLLDDE
ncbi:hypothetical protein [Paenibacillus chitinolyticus]|uniref:hypothetical protein n=1 Tax=Paenibacillus chitinolyticus TaxID=79263 RepID=UPI001C4690C3|nr:hypothetical protein [Paenibacillus chitinolyticus]MBV6717188.1 hypothetical protein [Paenibacillus chitinolyticus]